jgi:hypothetical protein
MIQGLYLIRKAEKNGASDYELLMKRKEYKKNFKEL